MATCSNSVEITNCAICLETLNIPKYLPCLHTFCENCIASHISTSFEKGNKASFDCPICRTSFSVPYVNCSSEDWAKGFPLNLLVIGLVEKQKIERAETQCMSCQRLEKSEPALFVCVECSDVLCKTCHQCHKANKFTSGHKTVSITNISEVEKSLNFFRYACPDHKNEELKLFCVDHDVPCCSLCVSVTHRKCNEVVTVDQAANGFLTSESAQKIETNLQNIANDAGIITAHNKKCQDVLNTQFDVGVTGIDTFCQELVSKIDIFKQKRKDELVKTLNEKQDRIETNIILLENLQKRICNEKEVLKVVLQQATLVEVMVETKKLMGKQEQHIKTVLESYEQSKNFNLLFNCNLNVDTVVQMMEEKCRVECEINPCFLDVSTIPPMKLKLKCTTNLNYQVKDCFCSRNDAVVILSLGRIDIYNMRGANVCSWSSYYQKRGYAYNSPAISEGGLGELASTTNDKNLIEFMDLRGSRQYTTAYKPGNVTSMAIKDQLIAIGFHDRIDIVNKPGGGTVVSFVASSPKFLYIDSESRLFYYESNKIVCRSMEGKELFSHTNDYLADISGMTLNTKGNICVSSGGRNTVSVLFGDRSMTTDILTKKDGLTRPSFVHFSPNGKHLLVINNNNIQMLLFDII
jgi:hypothetical protein